MKRLQNLLTILLLFFIIYIIINLIHLTWKFLSPEGIWSFFLFTDTLRIVFISLIILISIFIFIYILIKRIVASFKEGFRLHNFSDPFIFLVVIILSTVLDGIFNLGPSVFFTKKMADKYSYVNRSEELINRGEYRLAVEEATNAYQKINDQKNQINPFFTLSYLAQKNGYILNPDINERY